jgi:hypothetical protein
VLQRKARAGYVRLTVFLAAVPPACPLDHLGR